MTKEALGWIKLKLKPHVKTDHRGQVLVLPENTVQVVGIIPGIVLTLLTWHSALKSVEQIVPK